VSNIAPADPAALEELALALQDTRELVDRMSSRLLAFRDLVEAAEAAGWDIGENAALLNRARDAYAALAGASQ
jgi:hypothetical protein